jgi:hypothetical protein
MVRDVDIKSGLASNTWMTAKPTNLRFSLDANLPDLREKVLYPMSIRDATFCPRPTKIFYPKIHDGNIRLNTY